jgi:hypothetical protein
VATAMLEAVRASEPSCAATAATPANISPEAVNVADRTRVATGSPPQARVTRKDTTPTAIEAMTAMRTATASRLDRASTPEASSSACPESSSARLLRITTSTAISPEKNAPSCPARHALKPSAVMRSRAGPKTSDSAGFAPSAVESAARSWGSGKIQA